jgi:FKBP-type peptidyl-prolyl cis-trans isomerase 2
VGIDDAQTASALGCCRMLGAYSRQATVTDVSGASVTLDTNHSLADQDLAFVIRLADIV